MRRHGAHVSRLILLVAAIALWGTHVYAQTPPEAPDVEMMREHLLFTRGPGGVQVLHMMELVNAGPRVAASVPLSVLETTRWIDAPENLILEQQRAVDPEPLAVGEVRRYVLVYEIPWQRLPMPIRRAVYYPTRELLLWAEADELDLRGVNLQSIGREEIGDEAFDMYFMADLPPHPAWQVVLDSAHSRAERLPSLAPTGQRGDPVDILRTHPAPRLILGALLIVGLLMVTQRWLARRRPLPQMDDLQSARPDEATADSPADATAHAAAGRGAAYEIAHLKEEIVRLDVAFETGELDEATYKQHRDELKERLVGLMSAEKKRRTSGGERP